jgi:hypothetical protein
MLRIDIGCAQRGRRVGAQAPRDVRLVSGHTVLRGDNLQIPCGGELPSLRFEASYAMPPANLLPIKRHYIFFLNTFGATLTHFKNNLRLKIIVYT